MIGPWLKPHGTCGSFGFFATRGRSLFSNRNPEMAVLGPKRGQMKKIRPLRLCKWGYFDNKSGLIFSFWPPGGKVIKVCNIKQFSVDKVSNEMIEF